MRLLVNGESREVPAGVTVAALVGELIGADRGGVAVAVNEQVVRRAAWATTRLDDGDRVEVLTAVQGG